MSDNPSTDLEKQSVASRSLTSDFRSLIYAGCLDSDPFFSLKQCDSTVLSGLRERGIHVRELQKELPKGKLFRKLNRNLLYPLLVAKATRGQRSEIRDQQSEVCHPMSGSNPLPPATCHLPPVLHISSQCYAHLIPRVIRGQRSEVSLSAIASATAGDQQDGSQSTVYNSRLTIHGVRPLVSITVHDVAEFDYPEGYTPAQLKRWKKRIDCLKYADLVFAISEFTKKELVAKAGVSEEKIVVNHNGVGCEFRVLKNEEFDTARNALSVKFQDLGFKTQELKAAEAVTPSHNSQLTTHNAHQFLVLATGANIYRKNLPVLLEAVARLRTRGVPAVLLKCGDPISTAYSSQLTALGISEHVHDLGFVSQTELISLYNLCDAFAFPSLYEGFGLPVIEAQRCGLPCVISNAASLPEVGGDGALYHDPNNADQLADQLQRVYEDVALRESLREKGLKNAERFSWERHVDTLINGWSQLGVVRSRK